MVYVEIAEPFLAGDLGINSPAPRMNPGREIWNRRYHLGDSATASRQMRDPLVDEDAKVCALLVGEERRKSQYLHEASRMNLAGLATECAAKA